MQSREEIIKGLDALDGLIKEQSNLQKDGLVFILEHKLWKEFMDYHCEQTMKRGGEK